MPPKVKSAKKREVKPKKIRQKQKQKQKQQQNVKVNITQSGGGASGGGGGSIPVFIPQPVPQQFRDTSGENMRLTGLIKSLENRIANFRLPVAQPAAPNPENDQATQTAVFNAPITYNDTIAETISRAENTLPEPPIESNLVPDALNAPITYNDNLEEAVLRAENLLPSESSREGRRRKKKQPVRLVIAGEEDIEFAPSEYGGAESEASSILTEIKKKRVPRKDKGIPRGSIKEKYILEGLQQGVEQGLDIGIPVGRDVQNEFVMGVEKSAKIPAVFRVTPNEQNQPASSSSNMVFV